MITFLELAMFAGVWAYIFIPYFFDDTATSQAVPPASSRKKKS